MTDNLPVLVDVTPVVLAQIARAVAQDISLLSTILEKHGLTEAQYEHLQKNNAYFRSTLEQEIKNWQSIKSTEARLRLQAQAALESQMPTLAARMDTAKLGEAVEAAKLLARIAGVDAAQSGPVAAGEGFTINIDLGAGARIIVGTGGDQKEGGPPAIASGIPEISIGPRDRAPVPVLIEGTANKD